MIEENDKKVGHSYYTGNRINQLQNSANLNDNNEFVSHTKHIAEQAFNQMPNYNTSPSPIATNVTMKNSPVYKNMNSVNDERLSVINRNSQNFNDRKTAGPNQMIDKATHYNPL